MKRNILTLGLLSLAALGLGAAEASAYWWRFCCCQSKCCTISIKPYNAFSPVCCGSSTWYGGMCGQQQWCPTTAWTPDCCIPAPATSHEVRIPNGARGVYTNPITPEYAAYPAIPYQTMSMPMQQQTIPAPAHQTYYQGNWAMPQAPRYWYGN